MDEAGGQVRDRVAGQPEAGQGLTCRGLRRPGRGGRRYRMIRPACFGPGARAGSEPGAHRRKTAADAAGRARAVAAQPVHDVG